MLRVSPHRIKDHIHRIDELLESLCLVVHDSFSAKASYIVQIGGGGSREHMNTGLPGQLYGLRSNVARGPMDEQCLPSLRVGIVEEHLPGCDPDDRSRGRLDRIQALWFVRHHPSRRKRIFGIRPGPLLAPGSVHVVANLEPGDVRADRFDDS